MTNKLSRHWNTIQDTLFPILEEKLSALTKLQERLVTVLDFVRVEEFLPYYHGLVGAPECDRAAIARAFVAKKIYKIETNKGLIDRLHCDRVLRQLCGWEHKSNIPSESTFSRAFSEFSRMGLPSRIHESFIKEYHSHRIIGHISRDATAIVAREKAEKKPKESKPKKEKKKRGRPKKGDEPKQVEATRLERQLTMNIKEMLAQEIGANSCPKPKNRPWAARALYP